MISMRMFDVMNSRIPCGRWYAHRDIWALLVEQFPLILFSNAIFGCFRVWKLSRMVLESYS